MDKNKNTAVNVPVSAPGPQMGYWTASALVVGNIIGGGVFMLPASLSPLGYNALFSWVITLAGSLCLAYVFAMFGREMPEAGGAFGFMRMGLGEGPAFMGAWGYWMSVWTAVAAIATSGISYLSELVPVMRSVPWASPLCAIGMVWIFTLVNLRGVEAAGPVQVVTTAVKLVPLLAIPVLLLQVWRQPGTGHFQAFDAGQLSWPAVSGGIVLTLYAMLGLESAAIPGDKIRNPRRNIPLSTLLGTVVSGLLMMTATAAVIMLVPASVAAASPAPLSLLLSQAWGSWAGILVAICAVVSAYGAINGWVLISGELPATMASRQRLPAWFGVRNRNGAPQHAILLSSVLTTILIAFSFSGTLTSVFSFAISLSSVTCLVLYIFCCASAFRLMRRGTLKPSFGMVFTTAGGLLFSLEALQGASWQAMAWASVLLLAGLPIHLITARERRETAR